VETVSVIVVNWNGKSFLADCLEGIRQQTYGDFSVIVVDNGSNDGSLDYVRTNYPEVKTIALSKNKGFAIANNIAIRSVQTKYVALQQRCGSPILSGWPIWCYCLNDHSNPVSIREICFAWWGESRVKSQFHSVSASHAFLPK